MNSLRNILVAVISALSISAAAFAQPPADRSTVPAERSATVPQQPKAGQNATVDSIQEEMKEALKVIQENYGGSKTLDYNEIFKSSIDSMLHTLDPHSNYYDVKEYEQFKTDQSSRYYGIGATIGDLSDPDGKVIATYIKATFDGAPAHKAGLRYGDKIVEVNGTSMLGKPFNEVRGFLRGPEGTSAKIVVERLGTGKRETFDIIRGSVPQPSIGEAYMIRPGVGYISMRGGFNQTTYAEFVQAMRSLKAAGMEQLVIDLRDNGGGLVFQAYRVANAFLSEGQTVITQKGRVEGVTERLVSQNRTPDRSPIVVLVNRNTASASEILAGALQDHDRALIVGESTFGKALVTFPFQLKDGSMLLLTIGKYETPSGRLIQRDYSNGELYNYYTDGGSFRSSETEAVRPKGTESKTDTGRSVYGGGGINPDIIAKPQTISIERSRQQPKLINPVLAFSLETVAGRIPAVPAYKVDKPIVFDHDIKAADFPVTENVFAAFKQFAIDKYKVPASLIDREREFVERSLRSEFITAAYGSQSSFQVINEYDDQLKKAIEVLPQARQLALQGERAKSVQKVKVPGN